MISQIFFQNYAYFVLESQKIKPKQAKKPRKFLMPQGHCFAAHQCTCCGTAVGNHFFWNFFNIGCIVRTVVEPFSFTNQTVFIGVKNISIMISIREILKIKSNQTTLKFFIDWYLKNYIDEKIATLSFGCSSLHLPTFKAIYIKSCKPNLCRQRF